MHGVGGHCSHSYLHFGMWMVGIHHIDLVLQLVHTSVVSELTKEVEFGLKMSLHHSNSLFKMPLMTSVLSCLSCAQPMAPPPENRDWSQHTSRC